MNEGQLYDERIKNLEREVRQLKTSHFKTATKISTISKTIGITFSLYLDTNTFEIYGDKRAIITLTTSDNSDMISACYVNGLNPTMINNNRFLKVQRIVSDSGKVKYEVIIISYNSDDYNTLSGGGSVNLNYTLTLVGSSNFTASVSYRNFFGGSS